MYWILADSISISVNGTLEPNHAGEIVLLLQLKHNHYIDINYVFIDKIIATVGKSNNNSEKILEL